jgi:exodeoxyribonuclease I
MEKINGSEVTPTLYWHDYETFGTDPAWDRPAQFAGIRTNENLEIVGDPLVLYCKPSNDMLPDPEACLITGITPQLASQKGLSEAHFTAAIHEQLANPATCGAGYNSLRFDDEITRNCLYRNFYDPYAREWQHSNSRWDIIDMLRLARALRPEFLEWPNADKGLPSFRLEDITRANGIEHSAAHDALADVYATIAVARLIRDRIPKLYSYVYTQRDKHRVGQLLLPEHPTPVLHVSSKYPSAEDCIAVVAPLVRHPINSNGVIVYNLAKDPSALLEGTVEEIRERLFTARERLAATMDRVALKTVHLNRCPVIVPLKALRDQDRRRLRIDLERCLENWARIRKTPELSEKISAVFSTRPETESDDPDLMLYSGGFFNAADRARMAAIRNAPPDSLRQFGDNFDDPRLPEMLFRYRARNFPETLSESETTRWNQYRLRRITLGGVDRGLDIRSYKGEIERLRLTSSHFQNAAAILDALWQWGENLTQPN